MSAQHKAMAQLGMPVEQSIAEFEKVAQSFGLEPERSESALVIHARLGRIELGRGSGEDTILSISAEAANKLQDMRDLLTERITTLGAQISWRDVAAHRGRPANLSVVSVTEVRQISPSYRRVTIEGDDLARFVEGGMHFRLLFGPDGADWPGTDENGVTVWPGGIEAWHRPVYTTRAIEILGDGAARIEFDIFLHDGGRVTEWSAGVAPGAQIAITGPGGSGMPAETGWIGVIADETAVPVAARILQGLPEHSRGVATFFVPEAADVQEIDHPKGVSVHWEVRSSGVTPLDALEALSVPDEDCYVFFAAARSQAVEARQRLTARGLAKKSFLAAAYWNDGA
ncbi:siderophore-interacting protein [Rhodobacteraceae bacterium D3-12]|nr:siderophore-interacting protein [Rhodobacteraceae bacterium D3-12]